MYHVCSADREDEPGNDTPGKPTCPGNCVNGFIGNEDRPQLCPEHRAGSIARIRKQKRRIRAAARYPVPARGREHRRLP